MKQALLVLGAVISSGACEDWRNGVYIEATTLGGDEAPAATSVRVTSSRSRPLGHGDYDVDPVTVEVAVGVTATGLVPAVETPPEPYVPHTGVYQATLGPITELHVELDGVLLVQATPRLTVELAPPSPGSPASVRVTAAEGDRIEVSAGDGLDCVTSSDGVVFEIAPACTPSPGRYPITVTSSRGAFRDDEFVDEIFDNETRVRWDLERRVNVTLDVP